MVDPPHERCPCGQHLEGVAPDLVARQGLQVTKAMECEQQYCRRPRHGCRPRACGTDQHPHKLAGKLGASLPHRQLALHDREAGGERIGNTRREFDRLDRLNARSSGSS